MLEETMLNAKKDLIDLRKLFSDQYDLSENAEIELLDTILYTIDLYINMINKQILDKKIKELDQYPNNKIISYVKELKKIVK